MLGRLSSGSVFDAYQEELGGGGVHLENTFGPRVSGFVIVGEARRRGGGGGWETKDPPESIKRSRYPRLQECEWSVNNTNQTNTETNKKQQNRWNESYVIHELKEPQKTRRNEPDMFIWIGNLEAARRKCFKNDFYLSSMPRSRLKNSSRRGLMGRSVSTAIRRLVKMRVQPNAGGCSSKWDIFN